MEPDWAVNHMKFFLRQLRHHFFHEPLHFLLCVSRRQAASFFLHVIDCPWNAEHHFVIAYTDESIFFIPALPNPMTMKIMKYSGERGAGLGSLVSHTILGSDSADGVEMVPASAVSGVEIDEGARKVRIAVGDEVKKYQFKEKDCFGGDHEEALRDFFHFLRGIRG